MNGLLVKPLSVPIASPSQARSSARSDAGAGPRSDDDAAAFCAIYDAWVQAVMRWLRALGAPPGDLEDLTQDVFIVVRRKLAEFDGGNLGAWLYAIVQRTVSDYRRRAWFRNLVLGRRETQLDDLPDLRSSPVAILEDAERRHLLWRLIERMNAKKRVVFVLFEVEGYSGEDIAALEHLPLKTVWSRLREARKDFARMVEYMQRAERGAHAAAQGRHGADRIRGGGHSRPARGRMDAAVFANARALDAAGGART